MPWWISVVLMAVAVGLWLKGRGNSDDVYGLLEKLLAITATLVVLLFGHSLVLELLALVAAMRLPQARREKLSATPSRESDSVPIHF